MRPLRLTISAFGSYAGEDVIPFEQLGTSGIYAITGDTGAGKTTIFDAITYALYGSASGDHRQPKNFRSEYADKNTPTYVELEFFCKQHTYLIKRNPEYLRPAKRGEGMVKESAGQEFILPDGRVLTRNDEINEQIETIIGVNKEQFTQIAMIAQGEFLKLLLSGTEKRIEIFRKIFNTSIYEKLQGNLKAEESGLERKCRGMTAGMKQEIDNIRCDKDSLWLSDVEKLQETRVPMEEESEQLLQRLLESDSIAQKETEQQLEICEQQEKKLHAELTREEQIQKQREKQKEQQERLSQLAPQLQEADRQLKIQETHLSELEQVQSKVSVLEAALEQYDLLEENRKKYGGQMRQKQQLEEKRTSQTGQMQKLQQQLEKDKAEREQLTDAGIALERIKAEKEKNDQLIATVKKLVQEKKDREQAEKEYEQVLQMYQQARQQAEKERKQYELQNRSFLDAQAGLLACNLKEGAPCPVCGSTKHPVLAKLESEPPTEQALLRQKKLADKMTEEESQASRLAGEKKGKYQELSSQFLEDARQILEIEEEAEIETALKKKTEYCNQQFVALKNSLQQQEQRKDRLDRLQKTLPENEEKLRQLQEEINATENQWNLSLQMLETLQQQMDEQRKNLEFASKQEALDRISKEKAQIAKGKQQFELAKQQVEALQKEESQLRGSLKTLEENLSGKESMDVTEKKAQLQQLKEEKVQLQHQGKVIFSRIENNQKILKKLQEMAGELQVLQKQHQWVRALSETANGELKDKDKIKLETYIQMHFFDQILSKANVRLMMMSNGQYELKRRETAANKKSQSGLDLDVLDHYNGSVRQVNTLSGGESFEASLALALGLSDTIQAAAGGVHLDAMFIDEGFGSLDEETMEHTMRALMSLGDSNRLVGIISHVEELKSRIDKQIVVTKDVQGGSHAKIVV